MANVYEKIKNFYKEKIPPRSNTIKSNKTEKYFRLLAWRGASDAELQEKWLVVKELLLLFVRLDPALIAEPEVFELQAVLYRAYEGKKSKLTKRKVNFALTTLQDFLTSLGDYDTETIKKVIVQTEHSFYEHGYFHAPPEPKEEFFSEEKDYNDNEIDGMNGMLDILMNKMQVFFSQPQYAEDLLRATMLFMRDKAEAATLDDLSEEAWFSFWDYFFFDYHLRQTDMYPVLFFLNEMRDELVPNERSMLAYLARMRFRIFYIEQSDEDCVWCRDLLTDEQFDMPWPETPYLDFRQLLFCGHLESKGMLLLNYVTSYSASPKLRQRIQHEVMRLYGHFCLQWPEATIADFLNRHAIAVRHIIQVLTGYAQLNVVPSIQSPPPVLSDFTTKKSQYLKEIETTIRDLGESMTFSKFSTYNLAKLYADFYLNSSMPKEQKVSFEMFLAAACAFLHTNFGNAHALDEDMKCNHADMKKVNLYFQAICQTIDLKIFDPRYAAEEGYVLSLFKHDI